MLVLDKRCMYALVYTNMNTYSITDLRQKTLDVVNAAQALGYVQIIHNSKAKVAVVDSEYLAALQEAYEDYLDSLEFDRTINLPRITLDEYLKQRVDRRKRKQ